MFERSIVASVRSSLSAQTTKIYKQIGNHGLYFVRALRWSNFRNFREPVSAVLFRLPGLNTSKRNPLGGTKKIIGQIKGPTKLVNNESSLFIDNS